MSPEFDGATDQTGVPTGWKRVPGYERYKPDEFVHQIASTIQAGIGSKKVLWAISARGDTLHAERTQRQAYSRELFSLGIACLMQASLTMLKPPKTGRRVQ